MIDVAVLAGGCSPEHEVSLRSARQVLRNLDRRRWRPWPVLLDRHGLWWVGDAPFGDDPFGGAPSASPGGGITSAGDGELAFTGGRPMRPGAAVEHLLTAAGVDVVLPVLHGRMGEDGTVQGMLEMHDLPFVGSGCAASAVAMDKIRTRECLTFHGVPMPRAYVPSAPLRRADARAEAARIEATIGFPAFLKVDLSGSTIGVQRVEGPQDVRRFLDAHRHLGRRFVAEEEVPGEEVTVAVLGNSGDDLEVLPPIGIYPVRDPYFTYEAKYQRGACEEVIPPRGLDGDQLQAVRELGRRCHEALQCDGMSRTDVIVGRDGPRVLEVNTIPGLTETSLLPQAARAHGLSFAALIDRLLELALLRARGRVAA